MGRPCVMCTRVHVNAGFQGICVYSVHPVTYQLIIKKNIVHIKKIKSIISIAFSDFHEYSNQDLTKLLNQLDDMPIC